MYKNKKEKHRAATRCWGEVTECKGMQCYYWQHYDSMYLPNFANIILSLERSEPHFKINIEMEVLVCTELSTNTIAAVVAGKSFR